MALAISRRVVPRARSDLIIRSMDTLGSPFSILAGIKRVRYIFGQAVAATGVASAGVFGWLAVSWTPDWIPAFAGMTRGGPDVRNDDRWLAIGSVGQAPPYFAGLAPWRELGD